MFRTFYNTLLLWTKLTQLEFILSPKERIAVDKDKVMKIIIFGIGNKGRNFYNIIKKSDTYNCTVIAFSDNNYGLWNTYIDSIPVIPPPKIKEYDFDAIVVASIYENEICKQLEGYGLRDKVLLLDEYERKTYALYKYQERYRNNFLSKEKIFHEKVVVYTSITGNYDDLNEPLFLSDDIEYVCFTNNKSLKSPIWNIEYITDNQLDNMHLAKKVKLFPDEFLSEYETSVWVDGKFQVQSDIREYIMKYQRFEPMLCFPHFSRSCIYEEAGRCIADGVGVKNDIIHQIACYEREGYPIDNGLYEMGCIVRNHNDDMVKRVMSSWWEEIQKYSYRDQISFPVVCWRNDFKPDICDQDIYKNKWLLCKRNYSKVK